MIENLISVTLRDAIAEQSRDYMGAIPTRREFLYMLAEVLQVSLDTVITVSPAPQQNVITAPVKGAVRYGRLNYGEIVECMIKAWKGKAPTIATKTHEDLRIGNDRIEIKAVDRFASPSANNFRTRLTWLVINSAKCRGVYETTYNNLTFNSHKHLKLKGVENFTPILTF